MAESYPSRSYEEDDNNSSQFESEFDLSQLVSPEEQAEISALVQASYEARTQQKSNDIEAATSDVHALIDSQNTSKQLPREVRVGGETWQVSEQYEDARGNTWIVGADGRQSMKFEEVISTVGPEEPTEPFVAPAVETAPIPVAETEYQKEDAAAEALVAAEAHLNEVVARQEKVTADDEPVEQPASADEKKQPSPIESDKIEGPKDIEDNEQSHQELKQMWQTITRQGNVLHQAANAESASLGRASDQVRELMYRMNRLDSRNIDSVLYGHINEALQDMEGELRRSLSAANKKDEAGRALDAAIVNERSDTMSGSGADTVTKAMRESQQELRGLLGRGRDGTEGIRRALGKINMLDPRITKDVQAFQYELRSIAAMVDEIRKGDNRHQLNSYIDRQKDTVSKALNSRK